MAKRRPPKPPLTPLQQEAEELLYGWEWDRVYNRWLEVLQNFGIDPEKDIFHRIKVFDPGIPERSVDQITWWPARDIQSAE